MFIKNKCYDMFDISYVRSESNNLIWIKFDIKPLYWNLAFNFICGFVYMSPEGSSVHSEENMFYVIEHEMANMKIKYPYHKFLIGGDIGEGSSVHSEENMFYVIEHEMANMKIKYLYHKFLIGGDFNAYTNQEPDFIQFDSMTHINDDIEYFEDTIPATRCNLDKRDTNTYGNALLDFCKTSGLRILNGRFGKDKNT